MGNSSCVLFKLMSYSPIWESSHLLQFHVVFSHWYDVYDQVEHEQRAGRQAKRRQRRSAPETPHFCYNFTMGPLDNLINDKITTKPWLLITLYICQLGWCVPSCVFYAELETGRLAGCSWIFGREQISPPLLLLLLSFGFWKQGRKTKPGQCDRHNQRGV